MKNNFLTNWQQLCDLVDEWGMLPLQNCGVPGFSVEAMTPAELWEQNGDVNPWEWRYHIVNSGRVVYGKFFRGKIGFVSKEWFSVLASYRRNGQTEFVDEDGTTPYPIQQLTKLLQQSSPLSSIAFKRRIAFNSSGRLSLDNVLTVLMMRTFLVTERFEQKKSSQGTGYGWPMSLYARPEKLYGSAFSDAICDAEAAGEKLYNRLSSLFPKAGEKSLLKVLG